VHPKSRYCRDKILQRTIQANVQNVREFLHKALRADLLKIRWLTDIVAD